MLSSQQLQPIPPPPNIYSNINSPFLNKSSSTLKQSPIYWPLPKANIFITFYLLYTQFKTYNILYIIMLILLPENRSFNPSYNYIFMHKFYSHSPSLQDSENCDSESIWKRTKHSQGKLSRKHKKSSLRPDDQMRCFLFPCIDLQIFEIDHPQQLLEFLKACWDLSPLLCRFHWTLVLVNSKSSNSYLIRCNSENCRYFIKLDFDMQRKLYKIAAVHYWHNHSIIKLHTKHLDQKSFSRTIQSKRQIDKLVELYGSHYIKELVKRQIKYNRKSGVYHRPINIKNVIQNMEEYLNSLESYRTISGLERKAIDLLGEPIEEDTIKFLSTLKSQITNNVIFDDERQQFEISDRFFETQIILYSNQVMQENFKKWGRSMYIGELDGDFYNQDIFINLDENDRGNLLANYIFCGADNELNITIFAIGIINGPLYPPQQDERFHLLPNILKKSLIRKFMTKMPATPLLESILIKEQHEDLLEVLENYKTQNSEYSYIIKYKLQSWEHINDMEKNPYRCQKSGILAELIYIKYYQEIILAQEEKASQTTNEDIPPNGKKSQSKNKRNCVKNKKIQRIKKHPGLSMRYYHRQQLRQLDIIFRRFCLALNEYNFSKASMQLMNWLGSEQAYSNFVCMFYPKMKYYCLRYFDQRDKNIGFIGFNLLINFEYWFKKKRKEYFDEEYDKFKTSATMPFFERNTQPLVFEEQQKQKLKTPKMFGYERWSQPQLSQNYPSTVQYNIVHETLRNLILIFTQNKSKFVIDENYLQNIGFNSGIEETSASNYKQKLDTLKFKSNKILFDKTHRNYFQYFLEHLNVEGQHYRQNSRKLQKLPYYNLTKLYLSRQTQNLLFSYELMKVLEFNCFEITHNIDQTEVNDGISLNLMKNMGSTSKDSSLNSSNREIIPHVRVFYVGNGLYHNRVKIRTKKQSNSSKKQSDLETKWECDCLFTQYMGIPCRHILKTMTVADYEILQGFKDFWLISQIDSVRHAKRRFASQIPIGQQTIKTDGMKSQNSLSYVQRFNPITKSYEYKYLYDNDNQPLKNNDKLKMDEWLIRLANQQNKSKYEVSRKQRFMKFYGKRDDKQVMK